MGTFLEINILFFITFKMCSHNPKGGKIQVRGYDTHTHTCALFHPTKTKYQRVGSRENINRQPRFPVDFSLLFSIQALQ